MTIPDIDGRMLKAIFGAGVEGVSDNVRLINELNVFPVPDGDTGINLHHTLRRAWQEIANMDEDAVSFVAERFAYGALMGARGNSGTIMSQLLAGFADGLGQAPLLTAPVFVDACRSAATRAYAAVSQPVEGTILTVARESLEALSSESSLAENFAALIDAAAASLNNTPNLLPLLKEAGVVDAGGMGLLCFLQGMQVGQCRDGIKIQAPDIRRPEGRAQMSRSSEAYGYDVQFLMLGETLNVAAVRREMERLGWSVIVVGDERAIKVHLHADNPAPALDYAVTHAAALTDVVIENMELQALDYARHQEQTPDDGVPDIAVIAVVDGDGMSAIFRDLNCASVIAGGAGKNPSTEDFLNALKGTPARSIIVLPNHKDVVQAAEQAARMVIEKRVRVVPTTSMTQGIGAMVAFGDASDSNFAYDAIIAAMEAARAAVITIQITRATRAARLNSLVIHEGDFLAIIDGAIRSATNDLESSLRQALELVDLEDKELVTLYCGAGLGKEAAYDLIDHLLLTIKGIEFEVMHGGQSLYPLLVSVE